ncbi:MAG: hypothetical protein EOS70_30405 [Mesorhizobium sp.]|uniref:hypothetical protein n=1 Tax=Mesorhizobium sp. TaxID=1871066 RepID=UPI000FE81C2B|nr:hypothetical protein [Mesorhizobium sp.]RWC27076.1 MAG: hypothetical protein EOS70_30405 [Mesorhizobium sp.]
MSQTDAAEHELRLCRLSESTKSVLNTGDEDDRCDHDRGRQQPLPLFLVSSNLIGRIYQQAEQQRASHRSPALTSPSAIFCACLSSGYRSTSSESFAQAASLPARPRDSLFAAHRVMVEFRSFFS